MCVTQEQLEKQIQTLRLLIQEDTRRIVEEILLVQREGFNTDVVRHMSVLAGEYQWRLATAVEKVDMTWEKCEREHGTFERNEMTLAEKVALLEEYLPTYPRHNKGIAQPARKDTDKTPSKNNSRKRTSTISRKRIK